MLKVPSPFGEDWKKYEKDWGKIDYQNKVVLDIGADIGSTSDFFFQKGASKVIAVEGNPNFWRVLIENYLKYKFNGWYGEAVLLMIQSSKDYEDLIEKYSPDVVKVDCEGCEIYLKDVRSQILTKVSEYIVETHSDEIFQALLNKFQHEGFSIEDINEWAPHIRIIYVRKSECRS